MGTITDSVYDRSPKPENQAYSASVPVSVYRELAAELQAAEAAIHQLNRKNEYLAQENHVLRQEIAKTVNAVLHLQNTANYSANNAQNNSYYGSSQRTAAEVKEKHYAPQNKQYKRPNTPQKRAKRPRTAPVVPQVTEFIEPIPETIFIEEQQASYYYADESEPSQVSGWWLIFAIVLIIFMGFGAGYVVVRPLLENHGR
ncbi:MAG: hypothetical protein ACFCUV_28220 [Rivularia sp. (in: cyanobacteria)]